MVVQHNLTAMNAKRMLGVTTGQQAKSTEKLSSGFRINRAADDAAGLTISEKMRKQIRGLDQSSTNAQDGVSAVQTAEGALTEVHSMLQRMNELATQAANGSNSKGDRDAIQAEIEQLTTEIDRVAETTKFNEMYLLKGEDATKTINMKAHDAGLKGKLTDNGDGTATFIMDELKAGDSVSIGGKTYTIGATEEDAQKFLEENGVEDADTSKAVTINGTEYKYYDEIKQSTTAGQETDGAKAGFYSVDPSTLVSGDGTGKQLEAEFANRDAIAGKAGATVEVGGKSIVLIKDPGAAAGGDGIDDNNTSVITKEKAYMLAQEELLKANSIGDTEGNAKVGKNDTDVTPYELADATNEFSIKVGKAKVQERLSFNLHVGSDADMTNKIQVDISSMKSDYLGIKGLNVSDESGIAATYAVDAIADAISTISEQRSALGAVQNRLEHTIANLDNVVENTTAAESRIRDTDMAEEMVEYSKNNILAQAGQSMLAQSNQSTQGVLSLLQ